MRRQRLADDPAREAIRTDLGHTLFVEAGAGSGKTKSLVDRVVAIVLADDGVPLRHVAAVTFTDKAAAELRDKLRAAFETAVRDAQTRGDHGRAERAAEALDDLDSAAIGTLHSFAQRILGEHPIEAGLPPLIEVLDEVASQVAFTERWTALVAAILEDDALSPVVQLALSAGVKLEHLRSIASAFNAEWDRLDAAVLSTPLRSHPDGRRGGDPARGPGPGRPAGALRGRHRPLPGIAWTSSASGLSDSKPPPMRPPGSRSSVTPPS